jgi:hypothetical protein
MEWAYCWRCDEEVAMLDEEEFSELKGLYDEIRTGRLRLLPLYSDPMEYVLNAYEHMTGYRAIQVNAFLYHQISRYGPPCPHQCDLPLRTPRAGDRNLLFHTIERTTHSEHESPTRSAV